MKRMITGIVAAAVAVSLAGAQDTAKSVAAKGGGTVCGAVTFAGDPPAQKMKKLDDENATACKCKEIEVLGLKVDKETKGIADAVVEILECGEPAEASETPVEIDQKNCVFIPHVVVIAPGTPVVLKNGDEVLHNVKTTTKLNPPFNEGIPANAKVTKTFAMAERVKVTCDVHTWMSAWVVVTRNRYTAVTDAKGCFEIKDVPPGKYKVRVWHETLGTQEKEIELADGGKAQAAFELKKEKK
jgi:plastocyanin